MNVRAPEKADLEAVLEVLRATDSSVAGDSDWTASDLADEWAELDVSRDAWLFELDATVAGYASFYVRGGRFQGDGYVHPDFRNRGIGSEILRVTEERARAEEASVPGGERVYLQNATLDDDDCTQWFYRAHGYVPVRGFSGMTIDLEEEPEVPRVPGIRIRTVDHPTEARAVHEAHQEAFATHWEFRPMPWEEWEEKRLGKETFDPTLWWVAVDGDRVVGVSLCVHKRSPDQGWVDALGVRPEYRRRGIAEALLKTAFAEFFRRGERKVGLGVDAESPTGATRLYDRAGMRTLWRAVVWEKELRAG
jgi:mycothiol synthase